MLWFAANIRGKKMGFWLAGVARRISVCDVSQNRDMIGAVKAGVKMRQRWEAGAGRKKLRKLGCQPGRVAVLALEIKKCEANPSFAGWKSVRIWLTVNRLRTSSRSDAATIWRKEEPR